MNKSISFIIVLGCLMFLTAAGLQARSANRTYTVTSPDGSLTLTTGTSDGKLFYALSRGKKRIINKSALGLMLKDGRLGEDTRIKSATLNRTDETWSQPWGEESEVRNNYHEVTLHLQENDANKRRMDIIFRVFNDGIGFRYSFPRQPQLDRFVIMDELTEFAFPHDAKAWSIPAKQNFYEGIYRASALSTKDTMATPVTIEAGDSLFIAIHEANLTDYAGMNLAARLKTGSAVCLVTALTPWQNGDKVYAQTPFVSPWRTVTVTLRAADLITSRIMLNLNEPCHINDISWIEPGRYIGMWWGIHMKKYTWEQGPRHGATTANIRRYIDFAAKHGFSGVLVEGWNHGWGDKRVDPLSFTKPYPDYDLKTLCTYARSKGVRIIAHNETWGDAAFYESQLDSAFTLYQSLGINAVKTGYVNPMLDDKELQHSQYGVRHYRKVVETAAKYHLMIDNHESIMPTGLQRTYPNLMTQEAVRGQEYNAWSKDGGNPPEHVCTLPFTRALAGPMDFTPTIFDETNDSLPATHPHSTLAKQLAEFVVLYSPLQMAADMIENYEGHPALSFIESCPTTWAQTKALNAKIGRYITIARKDRDRGSWFIGSITDQEKRNFTIPLNFLDKGYRYRATIYEDSPGADYQSNPYTMTFRQLDVNASDSIDLHLARSGGAAVRIEKRQ